MKTLILLFSVLITTMSFAQVPNYVPANGLVGWWPFNGNANDESGNNLNGILNPGNNGALNYIVDHNGNLSSAIEFISNPSWNQLGPYVELLNTQNILTNSAFAINYFVSVNSSNQVGEIINKGPDNTPGVFVSIIANGALANAISTGGSVNQSNFPINTWTMVTITYTIAGQLALFINGSLTQTIQTSPIQNITSNFYFGSMPSGGSNGSFYPFQGKLDDVGFWNRALTACEIQNLYTSQLNATFVSAGADQTICNGEQVTLSASNSQNYSWNNAVIDSIPFSPTITQDYVVTADSANCQSSDTVTVFVNESTSSTQSQTALDTYTWPINNQTYTQGGTYTATIPNAAGCDSVVTLNLTLNYTGVDELNGNSLTISPNPTSSKITVKASLALIGKEFTIYDQQGKAVKLGIITAEETEIDLSNLSEGVYLFKAGTEMQETFKIIKQ